MTIAPVHRDPRGLTRLFDYTLFVGPSSCFHHNQDFIFDLERTSALCLTDADTALGRGEALVAQAIDELLATTSPAIRSLRILTSCQSAFLGDDYRAVARQAARRHDIVCVHQENNRMTVPARDGTGLAARTDNPQAFAAGLLDCAPQATGGQAGLVFMSEALELDPRNELLAVAGEYGLPWVQTLRQWDTRAGLAKGRGASLVVAADPLCRELARQASERWGQGLVELPISYDLDRIDRDYRLLDDLLGAHADVAPFRAAASRAVDQALDAARGRPLSLDLAGAARPWHLTHVLLDLGFKVERIECSFSDRAHPVAFGADFDDLLAAHPGVEEVIDREGFIHRRSKLVRRGPAFPGSTGPEEKACWGYFALQRCMETIAREVGA